MIKIILNSILGSMFMGSIAIYLGMGEINTFFFIMSGNGLIVTFYNKIGK